jgi:hypothetical protein
MKHALLLGIDSIGRNSLVNIPDKENRRQNPEQERLSLARLPYDGAEIHSRSATTVVATLFIFKRGRRRVLSRSFYFSNA